MDFAMFCPINMNCVIPEQPLSEMNKASECMKTQATAINQTTNPLAFETTQTGTFVCYLFNLIHLHQLCDSNPYSL
jgi:hypothetical protein